jgi:hypothetical protein
VGAGATVVAVVALGVASGPGAAAHAAHSVASAAPESSQDASASQGLDVLPFPGTPDAAAGTNVDFPAVSPREIISVTVVGSRSGVHAGRLSAQPGGRGTAFSPSRPFAAGERVTVTASLRSLAAGTASGAPGSRRLRFSFSVAWPASVAASPQTAAPDAGGSRSSLTHSFVTHPTFHVPWITTSGKDTDTSSGRIFLTSQFSQDAAYFTNGNGQIQWYHPTHGNARLARVQSYHGHPVITYWQGRWGGPGPPGSGRGKDLILNSSYKTIHTVSPGNGFRQQGFDDHDFVLTPQGTALAALWRPVHANLTSVGGPANGTVYDWIVQEVDLATNKVVWEWHAFGHVPLRDSYSGCCVPGQPYEYFHLNSIQQLPHGHVLISSRQTWTVYSIDMKTGRIAWKLGGKHSSFRIGHGAHFEWQHDAQLHSHGLLTVFDDAAWPKKEPQSRALEIHLGNHRATLVHAYTHKPPLLATAAGSVQILPNRNVFVGWGHEPYFSEYTPSGRQIFSDGFSRPIQSYRAYRFPWTGNPPWPPKVAVRRTSTQNNYNVYVSWNGATAVAHWQVLAGPSRTGPFKALKTVAWSSFETRVPVSTHDTYFKVKGLGQKGNLLTRGTSVAVRAGS